MGEKVMTDAEKREHLVELMDHFETAMLVTRTAGGGLRSRPLAVAEARADGGMYFATSSKSGKVHEIDDDPHVNVAMQNGHRQFVSVSGRAHVERDRGLVDRLWSESWKVWFPDGKDDPTLCLIAVEPTEAEYWDSSGATGLRYLFEAAKAFATSTRPESNDDRQNAKLPRL
ncbi:MAG: pyridoxamine 5'-phosphate oxidase family protein [Myxococcales bacterium]